MNFLVLNHYLRALIIPKPIQNQKGSTISLSIESKLIVKLTCGEVSTVPQLTSAHRLTKHLKVNFLFVFPNISCL